nr:hypothetical protein [Tanacetum cinerariifolium]
MKTNTLSMCGEGSIYNPREYTRRMGLDTQRRDVPVETSTSNALVSQCVVLVAMTGAFRQMKNQQIMPSWHLPSHAHQVLIIRDNALVELRKKFKAAEKERDELKHTLEKYVSVPTSPMYDRYKSGEGYHAVPPLYTRTFMPPKPDLVFLDASTVSETVPTVFNVKHSTTKPTKEMSPSNRTSAPIIQDWVSDTEDESEGEPMPTQKAPSFVQTSKHVITHRTSVKPVKHPTSAENLRKDIPKFRGHRHS